MLAFLFLSLILYCFSIISFSKGWNNNLKSKSNIFHTTVSVVIAVRNEESNIINLIEDLSCQDFPKELFNIIIIDDHSEDNTFELIKNSQKKYSNLVIRSLPDNKFGKKNAINFGVSFSSSEIILTTDADCRLNSKWLLTMVSDFQDENVKLVSGPVNFFKTKSIFQEIQCLEFLSLIGSGAGAIGINKPIFCNGANMAYKRNAYLEVVSSLNTSIASGDDVFLLHSIKKRFPYSIRFKAHSSAIVFTHSFESIKDFVNQRKRWAAKTTSFKDLYTVYTSVVVFLVNVFSLFLLLVSLYNFNLIYIFLLFFLIKNMVDFYFLRNILSFFERKDLLKWAFPFQIVYSFYIVFISIISQLKTFKWKNRNYSK